jgi:carbonic anhydrase/acetyltransferase-like protein (isoleucine patch superfamily)
MGSPAKVVRVLDAEAVKKLTRPAEMYVANWRRFKAGLKPSGTSALSGG